LQGRVLESQELVDLFYSLYNPDIKAREEVPAEEKHYYGAK